MKKKLDPFNLSLYGHKIIEASAGTGKTLTLIIIYLRLLLGINHTSCNKRVFSVQEILIVTFTQSTREELYKRIKENIHNLRIDCIKKTSQNPIFNKILCQITNFNDAIILLLKAENNINQAAIYTIHGFCYDALKDNILYSDIIKNKVIIENTYSLYLQSTCDFWNKNFYLLPNEIGEIISEYWTGPEHFLNDILPLLKLSNNFITINLEKKINIFQHHQNLINIINIFKKKWLNIKDEIFLLIKNTNINKRIYHDRNLLKWINIITLWATYPTKNYLIPRILNYFKYTTLKKQTDNTYILNKNFFKEVDNFLNTKFSLKEIFLSDAIINIIILIKKEKKNTSQIEFNDLLIFLYRALKKNNDFSQCICKKYPIALIDEFQDTDLYQYKIFKKIYNNNLLILIGDPKQSIYSFRGANIFSYLYAKSDIKEQYYLDTNWRASYNMTNSINHIFSRLKTPFLLPSLDFFPIQSPIQNKKMTFEIHNTIQPALRFLLKKEEKIYIDEYRIWISQECAKYISYWLKKGKNGHAIIKKGNHVHYVTPCDIVVLVRNKIEANIIKKALDHINIESCYLSEKKNIYHTKEAYELLLILKAILEPRKEKFLRQAMFTNILSYNFVEIDSLHENVEYWSSIIKKFKKYYIIWKQSGILTMINQIIKYDYCKKNTCNIINILYLSELLQKKSRYINNLYLLIMWFENKVYKISNDYKKKYTAPPSINKNCVKIMTIYKSKGLEYNIVWIPFAINFLKSKFNLYHNNKNNRMILDFNINKKNLQQSKIELLSEEIRLLYVALTRSALHCSIGIAPIFKKNSKKKNTTDLHNSALGYIIQLGKIYNSTQLETELKKISKQYSIELEHNSIKYHPLKKINKIKKIKLHPITIMNRSIIDHWTITSYSILKKLQKIKFKNNIIINHTEITNKNISYTSHTFPKGATYGILLHNILKKHNFNKNIDIIWLNKKLKKYQLSDMWLTTIEKWIKNIIYTPLFNEGFTLSQLDPKKNIKELEFYIPIEKKIYDYKINKIIKYYDNISKICPNLSFNSIQGMLTGSIDLVFFWKNKYYIVDYKSTWLGDSSYYYTEKKIKNEMIKNRYDLQYQLYTLALHRYLKTRIKKYQFSLHFGGIFYLFLRAMDGFNKKNGLFYTLPKYELVKKLDKLFSIEKI